MKIIVAPASFKGSLTSTEAAKCIADGARKGLPKVEITEFPLSDGGEGFVDVLVRGSNGRFFEAQVDGPLPDQRVSAKCGILGDGITCVIEMAAASGLSLVPPDRRDPKITSTFGVGQLIEVALDKRIEKIVVGIGGSATNDGGAGMAQALGVRLLRKDGTDIGRGGASLLDLHQIDISWLDRRVRKTRFVVASDVTNPLCGPKGASAIYGPQKGATPADVELLDRALRHYGILLERDVGIDIMEKPGSGAAGGMGAGCIAFLNARIQSGIEFVLNQLLFDERAAGASLIITGEGKIDEQTTFGKAITGVIKRAKSLGVPVVAVAGTVDGDRVKLQQTLGLRKLYSLSTEQITAQEAIQSAKELLYLMALDLAREYAGS